VEGITTKTAAQGRWRRILVALGIPRQALKGSHGPCLFCKGRDRARWTNYEDNGGYFCNQCGFVNGFGLLMKFYGWSFSKAAGEVDRVLGTDATVSMSREAYRQYQNVNNEVFIPRATRDCALWLRSNRPAELEGWLQTKTLEVRHWLEEQS
jgi:putative DNA primase/helicase